jgi:mannose-1-phosphate guanylyltransferase/phosphomannomutase
MKALILAAGKGERLLPLTLHKPKPMIEINKKPLLEYLILLCKKYGVTEIAVNTSYLPEKIKEYFGDGRKFGVKIRYSFEPKLLGTSGALNNFGDFFKGEPFLVIYGDSLTDMNLKEMFEEHKRRKGIATLALRKKPKEYKTQSLILSDKNFKITKFIEKPTEEEVQKLSGDFKLINSGIYIFNPKILDFIQKGFSDFAYDIFPKLISAGESIYGFTMDKYYFREVGKKDKYDIAKEEIESGKIKLNLIENE